MYAVLQTGAIGPFFTADEVVIATDLVEKNLGKIAQRASVDVVCRGDGGSDPCFLVLWYSILAMVTV